MEVRLAYGQQGLLVDLPEESTTVIEPHYVAGATDQRAAVLGAIRSPVSGPPLVELVSSSSTVAISVCDGTRPQPRKTVLPVVLDELETVVPLDQVVILVATGTHRANTEDELEEMFGRDVLGRVEVVNHDARRTEELTFCGRFGDGVPVYLNRRWTAADVRITTGFVEPHFFAGFSGGPKMVAPGLAGMETVLTLHDARRIGDPRATWGVTEGNPVHDDVRAIAAGTGVTFALDVVLNRDHEIVEAFGGELFAMHAAAIEASRRVAMRPVPHRFDVVVTTNAGFPLDQNLYQSVKGMSAAAAVVRPGGLIICAAECRDGFPDHGGYRELLASAPSPAALANLIAERSVTVPDQWQVQIQARVQVRARVAVHAEGLTPGELAVAHLSSCDDVAGTVRAELERVGPDASCCVLPEGPQTIPYVVETVG